MSSERRRALLSWAVGLLLLSLLFAGARRFFDPRDFAAVWRQLRWPWLLPAFLLQAATYGAQGQVWRVVGRACGVAISRRDAGAMSLGKLFMDQTLPSAGVSGTLFVAAALARRGAPAGAKAACFVVELTTYYAAVVAALCATIALALSYGGRLSAVAVPAAAFIAYGAGVSAGLLGLPHKARAVGLIRCTPLRHVFDFLGEADVAITHDRGVFLEASLSQLGVILLDAATVWVLLPAVGSFATPGPVFVSFMAASLFRSVGLAPGGLGAFEAGLTAALVFSDVPPAAALAATLLFRALSFWLPMAPGFVVWRREVSRRAAA